MKFKLTRLITDIESLQRHIEARGFVTYVTFIHCELGMILLLISASSLMDGR